jgi:glycosyltransferase involved in cell wall biosynthesis
LREICSQTGARFLVIGAGALAERDRFDGMELRSWSEAREIADIQEMDVGIMPLPDDPWARGKCGYKLIQYMACGLPVVASPVGVNKMIVEAGRNGFLPNSKSEWREVLLKLLEDRDLCAAFGEAGRARAVTAFSLIAHAPRLAGLFQSVLPPKTR